VYLPISLCFFRRILSTQEAILVYQFIPDCVEYGMYLAVNRAEGASLALQTLIANVTTAARSALVLFTIGLFGFEEELGAHQSGMANKAIWSLFTWVPSAFLYRSDDYFTNFL
jgi:Na+/melibiose symporter-like transporter